MAHTHLHRRAPNKKALWAVLILSVIYMVAEIVGGLLSGSLALLADAGHMATDSGAIALGLFAFWISQKPPTLEKTYGYYRAEILAALVNGALLVAVAFWISYEAWERLQAPAPIQGPLMMAVAAGGLVVNIVGMWLTHRSSKDSLNIKGIWLHLLSDALGSVSAMVGGALVWRFGWYLADPIISFLIAVLILFNSWKLLSECVNVLLEAVPRGMDVAEIKDKMLTVSNVSEIHDLHVWTLTSGVPALSAHVLVTQGSDNQQLLTQLSQLLQKEFKITHTTLQLETSGFQHPVSEPCH